MLDDGRLEVHDAVSAQLARTLLDATVAHPRPAGGPSHRDVTIVIPVRNNASWSATPGAARCAECGSWWSTTARPRPCKQGDFADMHCDIRGAPAHPRARGLRRHATPALPRAVPTSWRSWTPTWCPGAGWLEALLGHFCDPAVALVAPRIVGLRQTDNVVARYEAVRSSLDLGQREAPVVPYGTVSYVPSAAIICRRSAWSRNWAGLTRRCSPARMSTCAGGSSRPAPGCATNPSRWSLTNTAPNCGNGSRARHSTATSAAPAVGAAPGQDSAAGDLRMDDGGLDPDGDRVGLGYLASMIAAAVTGRRVANSHEPPRPNPSEVAVVAAHGLWLGGLAAGLGDLPALLADRPDRGDVVAALSSGGAGGSRGRRGGGLAEPATATSRTTPSRWGCSAYLLLKRLDDIAYGVGLWTGVVRNGTLGPLKPQIRT